MSDHDISAKSSGLGIGEAGKTGPQIDPETARIRAEQKRAMKSAELECHYCGLPAVSFGFFGEPVCEECGG